MYWLAQAPANIALIKYMGKQNEHSNLPDNSSLSYTLNNLLSTVKIEPISAPTDIWKPLDAGDGNLLTLSPKGQERFIKHLVRLKNHFNYSGSFLIQSVNNFPQGSGLASSASSFAALTRCAVQALSDLTGKEPSSITEQAQLSRLGSGSSCRSFYSPWALWKENDVLSIELPYKELIHQVVVISGKEKEVSSSQAHQRVKTSLAYQERPARAEERLQSLLNAFNANNWECIYQLCWDEFHDMHHLFHTCEQPFSYINQESQHVLNQLRDLWEKTGDGPIITMDAGPNIHLLYRPDQEQLARQFKADHLMGQYHVL